jgi:hypothetical protein
MKGCERMTFFLSVLIPSLVCGAGASPSIEHVRVYDEPGRFAGWPANHGIWSWGNEILVGFTCGYHRVYPNRHNIDRDRPSYALTEVLTAFTWKWFGNNRLPESGWA